MLQALQKQQKKWAIKNFGEIPSWQPLIGVVEEIGELAHSYLKRAQGIRNNEDHNAGIRDAIGDIVVYLADFCNREGIDFEETVRDVWVKVAKRDWKKNKDKGVE